ncbi:MAG: aminoacyl-tRNA hydrolase [Patescibacteria group bacterium]|nr:aminoacyl-tRNA hydrolase [Patescibacteria group bacterium]
MSYIIVGLGNPGEGYEGTRHNVGRMVLEKLRKGQDWPEWKLDKKIRSLVSKGKMGVGEKAQAVTLAMPETMMNNSGKALVSLVESKKQAEKLVVVYDDLDLALGAMKVSWNRGDGGHRGLASIIRLLKTREFVRVRIGVSPTTPGGKLKKPPTETKVLDFILGDFRDKEKIVFKKVAKCAVEALTTIVADGRERAMNQFNK